MRCHAAVFYAHSRSKERTGTLRLRGRISSCAG
jgi:hypothetical protein